MIQSNKNSAYDCKKKTGRREKVGMNADAEQKSRYRLKNPCSPFFHPTGKRPSILIRISSQCPSRSKKIKLVSIHESFLDTIRFPIRKSTIFRKVKEIKGLRGGVPGVRRTRDPAD